MRMKQTHVLVRVAERVDALTGELWALLDCPFCDHQEKLSRDTGKVTVLRLGEGEPTAEDAAEFAELCRTPAGRAAVAQRLALIPQHLYIEVDTAELARSVGRDPAERPGEVPVRLGLGSVGLTVKAE